VAFSSGSLDGAALVIDAIFGSGLSHSTEGGARDMIEALVNLQAEICAIDVPSGVDGASGQGYDTVIDGDTDMSAERSLDHPTRVLGRAGIYALMQNRARPAMARRLFQDASARR